MAAQTITLTKVRAYRHGARNNMLSTVASDPTGRSYRHTQIRMGDRSDYEIAEIVTRNGREAERKMTYGGRTAARWNALRAAFDALGPQPEHA